MARFCIIGLGVGSNNVPRNFYDDEAKAQAHGEALARKSYQKNNRPATLLLVEVKKVIEVGMPQVQTREAADGDIALSDLSESEDD